MNKKPLDSSNSGDIQSDLDLSALALIAAISNWGNKGHGLLKHVCVNF